MVFNYICIVNMHIINIHGFPKDYIYVYQKVYKYGFEKLIYTDFHKGNIYGLLNWIFSIIDRPDCGYILFRNSNTEYIIII